MTLRATGARVNKNLHPSLGEGSAFTLMIAALAAMPRRRRNTILAYLNTILTEEVELLATFLKGHRPQMSDEQVALICGISRAKLAGMEGYRRVKPKLADYHRVGRQPAKWRKGRDGNRWPLDPPD